MKIQVRRVILFVQDVSKVGAFYRDVLGLPVKVSPDDPKAWTEFEAGSCSIALHDGGVPSAGRRQPKIVFFENVVMSSEIIPNAGKIMM